MSDAPYADRKSLTFEQAERRPFAGPVAAERDFSAARSRAVGSGLRKRYEND
jgi:hypothetical protein